MGQNLQRSRGRPAAYKYDRGGVPAEMGPFIGIVVNNIDNTRSGRLQVAIQEFNAINPNGTPINISLTISSSISCRTDTGIIT